MAAGGSKKAIIAAMAANGGIAVAKFVGFLLTGASSMLAESIHSVADTSNQGLLLYGSNRATRDATKTHQFGYGRERYFWSFVVAMVLFSLGGLFAIFEGVEKIKHPHELDSPAIAIGILTLGIFLEGYSFRTAVVESIPLKKDKTWWEFIRTARTPELPVVLLEDAGAMIGLVVALAAIGTSIITGNAVWDGIGTLIIGLLLVVIAAILAVEMKSLLIGESATKEDAEAIRAAINATPKVERILDMKSQHVGPDELLVVAKIDIEANLDFRKVTEVIDAAESAIRAAVPAATRIYLEPDEFNPDHVPSPDRNPESTGGGHH